MGLHRIFSGSITRATTDSSGTQAVTGVGGKPGLLFFMSVDNANSQNNSIGMSDGSINGVNYGNAILIALLLSSQGYTDLTKCIFVQASVGGNGWSALITALGNDGFTITWTKIGAGLNITSNYIAVL